MMKNVKFKKGQQINTGSFIVSIGAFDKSEVAIISKSSGDFAMIKDAGKKMKRIKRRFNMWLNSKETFTFSNMTKDLTVELIDKLK